MIKFEKEKYERELKNRLKLPPKDSQLFTEEYWFRRFSKRVEKLQADSEPLLFLTMVRSDESELNPGIKSQNLEKVKSIANMRADLHNSNLKISKLQDDAQPEKD